MKTPSAAVRVTILVVALGATHGCGRGPDGAPADQGAATVSAPLTDLEGYRRCVQARGIAGIEWPQPLVEATCEAAFEDPLPVSEIERAIEVGAVAALDARFDRLLAERAEGRRHERSLLDSLPFDATDEPTTRLARRWLELAPQSPYAHTARGLVHLANAKAARGEGLMRQIDDLARATFYDELDRARRELTTARDLRPDFPVPYFGLIHVARLSSDRQPIAELEQAVERHVPHSFYARAALMHAAEPRWGGSIEEMQRIAERAQRQAGADPQMRVLLGQDRAYQGLEPYWAQDYAAGLAAFREGLGQGGPQFFYLDLASYAAFALGRYDESLEYADQLIRFDPRSAYGYGDRFRVHYKREDWPALLRDAEAALAIAPRFVKALDADGDALRRLGRGAEAQAMYERALAEQPNDVRALDGATNCMVYETHQPEKAIPLLDRLIALNPQHTEAHLALLQALFDTRSMRMYEAVDRFRAFADPSQPRQKVGIDLTDEFLREHPRPAGAIDPNAKAPW